MVERVSDWKAVALSWLRVHPLDYAGAAHSCGVSLRELRRLVSECAEDFFEVEEEYISRLESLCAGFAEGRITKEDYPGFSLRSGLMMLKEIKSWRREVKKEVEARRDPKRKMVDIYAMEGAVDEMLAGHLEITERREESGSGSEGVGGEVLCDVAERRGDEAAESGSVGGASS